VTSARDGREALQILFDKKTKPIDLVLTDIMMPQVGDPLPLQECPAGPFEF